MRGVFLSNNSCLALQDHSVSLLITFSRARLNGLQPEASSSFEMATNFAPILKVDPRAAPRLKSYGIPHGRGNIFLLGRVISFFHLGHNHDPPSGRLSNSDTLTFTGQWIHSKQRKFVVIETYVNHCEFFNPAHVIHL